MHLALNCLQANEAQKTNEHYYTQSEVKMPEIPRHFYFAFISHFTR